MIVGSTIFRPSKINFHMEVQRVFLKIFLGGNTQWVFPPVAAKKILDIHWEKAAARNLHHTAMTILTLAQ